MTIQRRRSFLPLMLVALIVMGLPALSGAQLACQPDGDVDQSGSVTAEDALLVFQQTLGLAKLTACQQVIADVFPQPAAPDGAITASDALCIFREALSLPSCLDILPPSNQPPMVDAGADQSVDAGTMVLLSGAASDPDGTIVSYLWEQTGGRTVVLAGATDATAMFTAPDVTADEVLTFQVTVADDDGAQASASLQVAVRRVNQPPVVNSSPDQPVYAGMAVTLTLRASDPDGTIVSYLWEQTDGVVVSLLGAAGPSAVFRAPSVTVDEVLTFRVTVTDDGGATAHDEVKVRVTTTGMVSDGFSSVSAGGRHTCAIRRTGEMVCWGYNEHGESVPPTGTFLSVSAGYGHTCAVRDTGELACWGSDRLGQSSPPAGTFVSVSTGFWEACGLRDTGEIECWGSSWGPPAGTFTSVGAGTGYVCAVRVTGEAACRGGGNINYSPPDPPAGTFTSVSPSADHACGIRDTGELECWGRDAARGSSTLPTGTFKSVSAEGESHTCGLRGTGEVVCWGWDAFGQSTPPLGTFVSVDAGARHTCGIRDTGAVECWGHDRWGQSRPFLGTFTSVTAGSHYTCGIRDSGEVACRGSDDDGETMPPAGAFVSVSAGSDTACGIRDSGELACWGGDSLTTPPAGTFTSVSVSYYHPCGIRDSGELMCWGGKYSGYTGRLPPAGTFTSVSGGRRHACGIRDTGTVVCWGESDYWGGYYWGPNRHTSYWWRSVSSRDGQTCGVPTGGNYENLECWNYDERGRLPPAGRFASLGGGIYDYRCGVRDTSDLVCWVDADAFRDGFDPSGFLSPPSGAFTSVSAHYAYACGIRDTGDVACWGEEGWVPAGPPPLGTFTTVSTGQDFACAIRDTGAVACWGKYMTYGLKESDF